MPATTTTREPFSKDTTLPETLQDKVDLNIKAGAIRCWVDSTSDPETFWVITEWNVHGQNDP